MKKEDLKLYYGEKFNMLTILNEDISVNKKRVVFVLCDCGTKKIVAWSKVKSGDIKSCGCLRLKPTSICKHRLHQVWKGMKQRCYNSNSDKYKYYGAKGVKICDRWLVYENFYIDNINRYEKGKEIDRFPEKLGDYNLDNTRWVSHLYNSRNMTSVKLSQEIAIEIRDSNWSLKKLADKYNVSKSVINHVRKNRTWKVQ